MMKWRIASNEIVNSATSYEALWSKMNGIKTTQLVNLWYLPTSANNLVEEFKKIFTINVDPLWTVLEAEAASLVIEAITHVGNDGTAIKNYITNFNDNDPKNWYFGKYYFTPERQAHGLDFLVYEIKDGKLANGK
jgi:hypothetical protein